MPTSALRAIGLDNEPQLSYSHKIPVNHTEKRGSEFFSAGFLPCARSGKGEVYRHCPDRGLGDSKAVFTGGTATCRCIWISTVTWWT